MARRQPRRGARKPAQKHKPKLPSDEAQPHKMVGHLVALKYNDAGKLSASRNIETALYRPNFKRAAEVLQSRATEQAGEGFVASMFIGQLWGAQLNEHREVLDEGPMGPVELLQADFGQVEKIVNDAVKQAREQEEMMREAQGEMTS